MKPAKAFSALALLLALLASGTAAAHGVRWGVSIGVPLYPPAWYYPPPAYYYPPVVVAPPAAPPVYIERSDPGPAAGGEYFWYYCPDSKTYYPYVKECKSPWQRVTPQPPRS